MFRCPKLVERLGPVAVWNGQSGPLHEGLTQELGALESPVHPAFVAAALGDRSDAGVALHLLSTDIAAALLTERGQQSRGKHRSGSRKGAEQGVVWECGSELGDLGVEALHGLQQDA